MVLTGSCPWPGSWSGSHGAHLHLQAREDPNSNGVLGPVHLFLAVDIIVARFPGFAAVGRSRTDLLDRTVGKFAIDHLAYDGFRARRFHHHVAANETAGEPFHVTIGID